MDPQDHKLLMEKLDRLYKLEEVNHDILVNLRTAARWSRFFFIVKWIVILGISIGAFFYVQPYIEQLVSVYTSLNNGVSSFEKALGQFPALKQSAQ